MSQANSHPQLSIIILSYNTKDLLEQTLNSIPQHHNWEIIVVDNHSQDDSVAMIKQKFPQVKIIENNRNLGFAAGNNIGINIAQGKYLLLLNSDTKIIDDAIEKLLQYLKTHDKVGAVTPKVVLPDGAIDLACHRGLPTPWRALTYFAKLEQLFPNSKLFAGYHQTYLNFDETHPVEATSATAMLIRKAVIDQVGLLDEQFFFYAEDLDLCKRITEAGWQIIYYPQSTILHLKSQSGKKRVTRTDQTSHQIKHDSHHHFYETMKQFYDKHYAHKYPQFMRFLIHKSVDLKKKWALKK